jgi:hypothetical protein
LQREKINHTGLLNYSGRIKTIVFTFKQYRIMVIAFFAVVLLFSLVLNAIIKINKYKSNEKAVWEDGDSVCVKESDDHYNVSFMQRLA